MNKKIFFIVILSISIFFILGFSQKVFAKSYEYENFEVDIKINKDSTFDVEEKQTFDLRGDFTFAYRAVELRRLDKITDLKVYDEKGKELPESSVSRYKEGNKDVIKWYYTAQDEKKTWIIKYKVHDGIGYFDTWDELYWNAVPNEREVNIENVKVTVHLPEECKVLDLKSEVYTEYPDTVQPTHEVLDGKTFLFTGHDLGPNTNFTIVAGWPVGIVYNPGILKIKSDPDRADVFLDDVPMADTKKDDFVVLKRDTLGLKAGEHKIEIKKWGYGTYTQTVNIQEGKIETIEVKLEELSWHKVLITILIIIAAICFISPVFLIILMYVRWRRKGKDPRGRGTIVPQYEPPDNIEPAVMGTLIDEKADMKDITATIIDLAVRGYLKIIEGKKGIFGSQDYTFKKLKDFSTDPNLKEFEKAILEGVFESSDEVGLSDLRNKFYTSIPGIQKFLYLEVMRQGYFEDSPDRIRKKYIIGGVILIAMFIASIVIAGLLALVTSGASAVLPIPIFSAAIIVFIFAKFMPKKTIKGVYAKEHAEGFKMYLSVAEKFRIGAQTPETFERFLPYAMIFGVEDKWASRFSDIYRKQPDWYESTGPITAFSMANFSSGISSMSSSFSSTAASSPSSSSGFGGGGGGGGGAGGGGGGGGGGAG